MIISGNFSQTPFYKAISQIMAESGILEVWNLPDRSSYTLYVKQGSLRCIRANGEFVDPLRAKAILMELLSAKTGSFEIHPTALRTPCEPSLKWPLEKVLVSLTIVDEEIKLRTVDLAPLNLAYRVVAGQNNHELQRSFFWEQAKGPLEKGATASGISKTLKLSENMVCYYLAKLERAGLIAPVRHLDIDIEF